MNQETNSKQENRIPAMAQWKIILLAWGVLSIVKGLLFFGPFDYRIDYVIAVAAAFYYWVYRTNNPRSLKQDTLFIVGSLVLVMAAIFLFAIS